LKEEPEKHPSGAKALVDFAAVMARLKSCPFKTAAQPEFFPQPVKPHSFHCIYTGDESPAYRPEEFFRSL
jgi:hypothetical protein